jgi:hypothetical protein
MDKQQETTTQSRNTKKTTVRNWVSNQDPSSPKTQKSLTKI